MSDTHSGAPAPFQTLPGPGGSSVPYYVVPFDKNGVCTGPRTLAEVVKAAGSATDVFVFSHGWNNDWAGATTNYKNFIGQFAAMRSKQWPTPTREYRPLLVGVFWPSAVLVNENEEAPAIAGGGPDDDPADPTADGVGDLAEALNADDAAEFYSLVQQDQLADADAQRLASLLSTALGSLGDDEVGSEPPVTAAHLMTVWGQMSPAAAKPQRRGGFVDDEDAAAPKVAGLLDNLNPRDILRATTVLLMKDRAGRVGAHGVGTMLRTILRDAPSPRVHLVGHSYGCKVVLSALSFGDAPSRPVDSVLLLQPATSALCFASNVDGTGRPGGYRPALTRTIQPIMTTFSSNDFPLTKVFHFAARRASDEGELVIAGGAPSRYAALGGYGPQGVPPAELVEVAAKTAPDPYDVQAGGRRIIAIRADEVISGHSDVANAATAWALLCQVKGP